MWHDLNYSFTLIKKTIPVHPITICFQLKCTCLDHTIKKLLQLAYEQNFNCAQKDILILKIIIINYALDD